MNPPRWISKTFLLAIHGRLLAEHGGGTGLRDEGLRESALASPRNRFEYEEGDLFDLAAAYARCWPCRGARSMRTRSRCGCAPTQSRSVTERTCCAP